MVSLKKTSVVLEKVGMLLLSLYPILYYYLTSLSFSYGQLLFFVFIIVSLFNYGLNIFKSLPKFFILFWSYAAVILILFSPSTKITYLIPGGINFFIWVTILVVSIRFYNFNYLQKYMRIIFIVSALIFVSQEILFLTTDSRFVALLPISDNFLYNDLSYMDIVVKQTNASRSSSLFMEPAYFAQYALCTLAVELFSTTNQNKLYTKFAVSIIFVLFFLRSGVGLLGLILLAALKLTKGLKQNTLLYLWIIVPLIAVIAFYYLQTDIGTSMLERSEEFDTEDSSAFLRIVRGFIIYDSLPFIHKLFGIPIDALENMNLPIFSILDDSAIFMNGFQTLLISSGIIGTVLLFIIYARYYKNNDSLGKTALWLLLLLSLVEQVYLMPYMLLLSVLIFTSKENISPQQ